MGSEQGQAGEETRAEGEQTVRTRYGERERETDRQRDAAICLYTVAARIRPGLVLTIRNPV
jgi:hypothetical protein